VDGSSTRLRLRVSPGARRPGVAGRHGDAWKLRVSAPPADGKANAAVLELLAETLDVPVSSLELVAGRSARDKIVALDGLSSDEAERRLAAAAGGAP
jgi:uncharacterized protein